ncbi:hypothetical protein [Cupriavidus basilensis]|uniref:hypothetical protein n=1 Tax=Cupriavidus basilensis TaxID=68895 RepID=UPI0039F72293
MAQVTIFRFNVYNPENDSIQTSRRWGTREAVEKTAKGVVIEGTARDVDESLVQSDIPGMTERDFNPDASTGPQRTVGRGY